MAELKIKADSGGGTVSFKGPSTTTSNAAVQLTLPVDDGTANQYLKTDGSGALSWATVDTSIADDSLTEAKLDIHAAPSGTDKFLGYTSNGMEWAVPGGGKILQVVKGTPLSSGSQTTTITANSTYTDIAGTTHSITPSAATSKILVFYRFQATARCGSNDGVSNGKSQLQRDINGGGYSTIDNMQFRDPWSANNGDTYWNPAHIVLDSPNTTSVCNYKLRGWKDQGDRIRFWDTGDLPSEQFLLIEVGA